MKIKDFPRAIVKPFVSGWAFFRKTFCHTKNKPSFGLKNRGAVLLFIFFIEIVVVTAMCQLLPNGINWYISLFSNVMGIWIGIISCHIKHRL